MSRPSSVRQPLEVFDRVDEAVKPIAMSADVADLYFALSVCRVKARALGIAGGVSPEEFEAIDANVAKNLTGFTNTDTGEVTTPDGRKRNLQ